MELRKFMDKKTILVFGVGELQISIIRRAKLMGLFTVGIDPCEEAFAREECDAFEVVGGQDYEGTLSVARRYGVSAIVTAATDKPLVMMARIAESLNLPCAKGCLIHSAEEAKDFTFRVICKPRDNSGSRGVKLCGDYRELQECIDEALQFSHLDTVLVEEFISGREFSIESLHYGGKSEVIQFTEKKTTAFPYNVELGHKQPANLAESERQQICEVVSKIASCMHFENCASHTELKINERGIFVIETSPRLGGDYINSVLAPLSTGINIEDQLLHIALGEKVDTTTGRVNKASAVCFISLPEGNVMDINERITEVTTWPNIISFEFKLKVGDHVNRITSSLNRYGQFIIAGDSREEIDLLVEKYEKQINKLITVK